MTWGRPFRNPVPTSPHPEGRRPAGPKPEAACTDPACHTRTPAAGPGLSGLGEVTARPEPGQLTMLQAGSWSQGNVRDEYPSDLRAAEGRPLPRTAHAQDEG